VLHEVLHGDEAVEVVVEGQEGLPYLLEIRCDFLLNLFVQSLYSIGKNLRLLLFLLGVLSLHLLGVPVLV